MAVSTTTAECPCYQMDANSPVVPECSQDHLNEIAHATAWHVTAQGGFTVTENETECANCGDLVRRRCKSVFCMHLACFTCLKADIRKILIRDETVECNACE